MFGGGQISNHINPVFVRFKATLTHHIPWGFSHACFCQILIPVVLFCAKWKVFTCFIHRPLAHYFVQIPTRWSSRTTPGFAMLQCCIFCGNVKTCVNLHEHRCVDKHTEVVIWIWMFLGPLATALCWEKYTGFCYSMRCTYLSKL